MERFKPLFIMAAIWAGSGMALANDNTEVVLSDSTFDMQIEMRAGETTTNESCVPDNISIDKAILNINIDCPANDCLSDYDLLCF